MRQLNSMSLFWTIPMGSKGDNCELFGSGHSDWKVSSYYWCIVAILRDHKIHFQKTLKVKNIWVLLKLSRFRFKGIQMKSYHDTNSILWATFVLYVYPNPIFWELPCHMCSKVIFKTFKCRWVCQKVSSYFFLSTF